MNKFSALTVFALVFALVLPSTAPASDKDEVYRKYPESAELLNNGVQGREFWIAIPPNEVEGKSHNQALEVYVASKVDTEVTLEVPGLGVAPVTKQISANQVAVFSDLPAVGGMSWDYEVRTSDSVSSKGILITSDDPISVYVLSARRFTSEGYMALPVSVWGKKYMHLSYYDYIEGDPSNGDLDSCCLARGGGFLVLAREDNTVLNFKLAGTATSGETVGGRSIGDVVQVNLDRGETYMIHGNGADRTFDISGTILRSNKAVGFISFHMRTIIPIAQGYSTRDMLVEMMPPLDTWGREFVTLEFKRKDRGDYFRLIASKPNTRWEMSYYDKATGALIGQKQGILTKAGDYMQYAETPIEPNVTSIRGVSHWTADKPVLLMQYSYSSDWDNDETGDPFMVIVPPVDQYIQGTVFQAPDNVEFQENWFNLFAVGDPNDPQQRKLKSVKLDGDPVYTLDPLFLQNRVPNTDIYWSRISVSPGAHRVTAATEFGAHIYGYDFVASYGWPAGIALNVIDSDDDNPPLIVKNEGKRGDFILRASETSGNGDGKSSGAGINAVELLKSASENYELALVDAIVPGEVNEAIEFTLRVADRSKNAKAVFLVRDRAGNIAVDSVHYSSSGSATGVEEPEGLKLVLHRNSPNPFNGITQLSFELSQPMPVTLTVFNSLGMEVLRVHDGPVAAGINRFSVSAATLPAGVYYYTLQAGRQRATQTMTVLR